jgi:hypothetical protein
MSDKRFPANIISSTAVEPTGSFEDSSASGTWSLQEAFTYVKAGLWPTAGNQKPLIEDVFSTYLYTGNGSTQTITNGIDLAGEGGLVWIKWRSGGGLGSSDNALFDTARGVNNILYSNSTMEQQNTGTGSNASLSAFNSDGFSLGADAMYGRVNYLNGVFASWTFRKAPRFFDVVTYTGDGTSGRAIAHNLRTDVGSIFVKRTDTTANWSVFHRSIGATVFMRLNTNQASIVNTGRWNDTAPTSTVFTLGDDSDVNASGETYVAYLFAHDPLGPSEDGSDGLIACGSYTGTASGSFATINLGWEPQFVLTKKFNGTSDWLLHDTMRGMSYTGFQALYPNLSSAEETKTYTGVRPTPTGFEVDWGNNASNAGTDTSYIYIAIRRGPMREPTSGTEVFAAFADTTGSPRTLTTGWPVDFGIQGYRTLGWDGNTSSRLQGGNYLRTRTTDEEFTGFQYFNWDSNTALISNDGNTSSKIIWAMRRAPGFFDVVAYTGNGVAGRTVPHNLGVAPEMMIVKSRSDAYFWPVWTSAFPITQRLQLQDVDAVGAQDMFNTLPTDSVFYLSNALASNNSGSTYIAYLFTTLAGISKVGSYTGNGSSQTIDCDFTTGARFILIKRTDSTGDWYVWDSARGIVAGNDPHLSLNTTAAEVTTDDSVDAESSGFIVNQDAATNVNVDTASYIFLAIA